jgi:ATP-binding cassette subfamily B protein
VHGVATCDWAPGALRRITALVPQEPVLFPGTIAQNIALGHSFDMEAVIRAAREAGAHIFISAMPDGYNTVVSERGHSLSGGQRQRIAIARALYCDAPILLLDEATSAMDTASEAVVHRTLQNIKGRKTILLVTHRASALALADQIITIE